MTRLWQSLRSVCGLQPLDVLPTIPHPLAELDRLEAIRRHPASY